MQLEPQFETYDSDYDTDRESVADGAEALENSYVLG